jgi:hypothetical protein
VWSVILRECLRVGRCVKHFEHKEEELMAKHDKVYNEKLNSAYHLTLLESLN